MNREETRADNAMRQRWIDGEIVQWDSEMYGEWTDCPNQSDIPWDGPDTFRIKPKTTIRPWTMEECPVGEVVVYRRSGSKYIITNASKNGWWPGGWIGIATYTETLSDFTMLNGDPCGVREGDQP